MKSLTTSAMVIALGGAILAPHNAAALPQWQETTINPAPARREVAVAAIGPRIYVLGGTTAQEPGSPRFEAYDTRAATWQALAPLPVGASHIAMVALGGRIYAFGGFARVVHAMPLALAWVYDPPLDSWTALPDLPVALGSMGAGVVQGSIHLVGGRDAGGTTSPQHLIYDPLTRRYKSGAPLPSPRDHLAVAVQDGQLHVLGGRGNTVEQNVSEHLGWNPKTGQWVLLSPLPGPRSGGAAAGGPSGLVYAGGECTAPVPAQGRTYAEAWRYTTSGRWQSLPPLPAGRHGYGAAFALGRYWFPGGSLGCGGGQAPERLLQLVP